MSPAPPSRSPYLVINSGFTSEIDDKAAAATLGAVSYLLQNLFGAGVGPNKYPGWSPNNSLLADLARVEFAKCEAAKMGVRHILGDAAIRRRFAGGREAYAFSRRIESSSCVGHQAGQVEEPAPGDLNHLKK